MIKDHQRILARFFAIGLFFLSASVEAQNFCGENDPARPVAECVNASGDAISCATVGATRMWPANFRPGGAVRGGPVVPNAIPISRDSTQRVGGTTVPGERSGHELFKSVSIVDNKLYVAYNAGLQVWNLDNTPENPKKIAGRDGFLRTFLFFPPSSEQLTFIEDIAAIDPGPTQNDLIFLSGKDPVGPSVWTLNGSTLSQLYQDVGTFSRQVRVVEINNVIYGLTATNNTVAVYNLTAASNLTSPCLDDEGTTACGFSVYRGEIPGLTLNRYLDVYVSNNRLYVAVGDGLFRPLKIFELPDPNNPSSAVERFSGTGATGGAGPAFFEYNNDTYLAFVQSNRIKIYDVDDCLDLNGCSTLGDCKASGGACEIPLSTWPSSEKYVTYSDSSGTPFLYYGGTPINIEGPRVEQLVDVSQLGSANPAFPEVTDNSGTYTDRCNGLTVDYWGDYYPKNDNGLRNLYPRIGKFRGGHFYRAAQAILDIHVRENVVVDPQITVTAQTAADEDTGAYWFGDNISFAATAQNCNPSATWVWDQSSMKTVSGINATTSVANLNWQGCSGAAPYCEDETVVVMASPTAGCADPDQVQSPNPFILKDPRARVDAINNTPSGTSFPAGTDLTFSADVRGKRPYVYDWSILNSIQQEVASGTGESLTWTNTCDAINLPDVIFADGFENGNLLSWSELFPPPEIVSNRMLNQAVPHRERHIATKGLGEVFDVRVNVTTTDNGSVDSFSTTVTLVPPGAVVFNNPALMVTDLGGGTFRLTANTANGTEWRWEIEDPDGEDSAACPVFENCSFFDWGVQGQEVIYSWQQEGTFNVRIWARNSCVPETVVQANDTVDVTDVVIEPLEVTSFSVDTADPDCSQSLGFIDCLVNRSITFRVNFTGNPTSLQVDWEDNGTFVSVGPPVNGTLQHTYNTTMFALKPKIRAVKGVETSATRSLTGTLTIANSL